MPTILHKYYPIRKILFFIGEGILIFATFCLCNLIFTPWKIVYFDYALHALRSGMVTLVFQASLYFFDLYDLRKPGTTTDTFISMMQSFGVGCVILGLFYFAFPALIISTKIFWSSYILTCGFLLAWRSLYYLVLERKLFSREIAVVGTGETAAKLYREITADSECGYTILAFVGPKKTSFEHHGIPHCAALQDLKALGLAHKLERIVIALDDRRGNMPIPELLSAKVHGAIIEDGISFHETLTGKILVEKVNPAWLIFSEGFDSGRMTLFIKRTLDLFLAVTGLLVSLPVTVITGILIKLESPGPVFYLQERVGEKERTFKVIKFRSMRNDAEKDGAVWASENDPRITQVGNFIRKVRIDEIPQMWNVLKGDMSFVGPRPERPIFVHTLVESIPYYSLRHAVKPGITGWAQVCYPYGASEEDALRKLEYDLYYIKNQSIFMDLLIIFRTIKTVLFQKGSR